MKIIPFLFPLITLFFLHCKSEPNDSTPPMTNDDLTIVGTWVNQITVPPDPTVTNEITFSGEGNSGDFLDQFGHSGTWTLDGDSITWIYIGVAELENTFAGKVDSEEGKMSGRNFGVWQGQEFEGSWEAVKK